MSAAPVEGELVVRRVPFEFPDGLEPVWHPGHREWSHMVNGSSLAMPYLEPFLIATLREAMPSIEDAAVVDEAKGFIAQEAQHYRTHRRYNELLKASGYPGLADVETAMERSYEKLRTRSLSYRLAYACGFETMTMGVTSWLVGKRGHLFHGSDTRVASFILWHMVEEVEHKRVAFDVYQAVDGSYLRRFVGVFTGSLHVFWWSRKACVSMLKTDGQWRNLRSRVRLWGRTAEFFLAIAPTVLRSASPRHDPRHEPDPAWVRQWIAGYADADPATVPLLDTNDRHMPVPFATPGG